MSDFDFPESDDLSATLAAPARTALPQDEQLARIRTNNPEYKMVACPRCAGTGMTRWGTCFKCLGRASVKSRVFKTSAADRAAAGAKRQERELNKANGRWATFVELQPARAAWVDANPNFDFARSMKDAVMKYGDLTERQGEAVDRLIARAAERAAQKAQTATQAQERVAAVNVANIVDCFQRAQEAGLKRFTLRFDGIHFQSDKATWSKIWVSSKGYGSARLGVIENGVYRPGRDATDEVIAKIALISADPMAAAKAYVQITSNCSVCGKFLKNQDSVDAGMGPICAGRINRPGLKYVEVKPGVDF